MANKITEATAAIGTTVGTEELKTINPETVEVTGEQANIKPRITVKDKARRHIDRISKKGVVPMVFEEVLTAYAAIGILKYDEVLEMSDSYAVKYIAERGEF